MRKTDTKRVSADAADGDALSEALDTAGNGPPVRTARRARLRRVATLVIQFFLGQGSVQGLNIVIGLYLVHVLSVNAYAQYGLATSFQQLMGLLMDLGFASTIIPLVGSRRDDHALVGRYVRAAKHLRDRSFLFLSPLAAVIFLVITRRHGWGWAIDIPLLVSILLAMYSSGKMSYYGAPLILYGKLKDLYLPQTLTGVGRLLVLMLMRVLSALNGWSSSLVTAVTLALNGGILERQARRYIEWPKENNAETDREVLRYILPAIPAMIFAAFQVQSAIFLISIFGGTASIAQVSALGRLSQLFSILTIFNAVIIEPFMARLEASQVLGRYMLVLAMACVSCGIPVLFTFAEPELVLRLLGSKYNGLHDVVGWAMLAGALNYIQVLVWIMNRSRKWIFWRGTILEIVLTLLIEILYIVFHGVQTTADAVFFSIISVIGPMVAHLYILFYGLSRGNSGDRGAVQPTVA